MPIKYQAEAQRTQCPTDINHLKQTLKEHNAQHIYQADAQRTQCPTYQADAQRTQCPTYIYIYIKQTLKEHNAQHIYIIYISSRRSKNTMPNRYQAADIPTNIRQKLKYIRTQLFYLP